MSAPPGVPLRRKPSAPARNSEWMERVVCRGSRVDFVSDAPGEIARAKRICADCPVTQECFDYAQARRLSGVFGGVLVEVGRAVAS